jgi:hypothetical protein
LDTTGTSGTVPLTAGPGGGAEVRLESWESPHTQRSREFRAGTHWSTAFAELLAPGAVLETMAGLPGAVALQGALRGLPSCFW